mgnify:CR=1 FL=1
MMDAQELFGICGELAQQKPTETGRRELHRMIALCAAEGCRQHGGTFGNLFSQIDYVCRQLGMKRQEQRAIQAARRHSNMDAIPSESDWLYDLKATALLISAVTKTDVPDSLLRLLPVLLRQEPKGLTIDRWYIRCIVRAFDATTIVAETDEGEMSIDYAATEQGRDFGYLGKLLRPGMMLNLLDNNTQGEKVVPGQIVVEPDFLIDVSALAACFTAYGHHPLLYTVNRLKPKANTQAILMGNFAGAALDDLVHQPQAKVEETLKRVFREQALQYCACSNFNAARFKQEARQQMEHIRESVALMSQHQGRMLLEPSFVCEKLGLQGRVDLMTDDMKLLVEQKAGRNMKIERQSHDQRGMQREDHYVQLLLYFGILHYNFGKSSSQLDIRLLYSKYEAQKGLMRVNFYKGLFSEALKLRNQIVATELLIAREGFSRITPLLRTDVIYAQVEKDAFFCSYVMPETEQLSQHLRSMQPLERAYYERMMTFVYREQRAQKLGSSEQTLHHSGGCGADLWRMSLDEKIEAGTIYTGLTISKRQQQTKGGGYDIITLEVGDTATDSKNFRRGDMVCMYAYDGTPDVRSSILYKGSLKEMTANQLVVLLNDGQQNPDIMAPHDGQTWAVEHAGSDVATNSSIRSLHAFTMAAPERKALLLGQRAPEADTRRRLTRSYNPHYDDVLLRVKQTLDYFLLVGPPGTGKTSMALRFMIEEEMQQPASAMLLMAYTNRAVDEICAMLTDAHLDYLRLGQAAACDPRFAGHLLDERLQGGLEQCRQQIEQARIVVSTTSMMNARPFILQMKHFYTAYIDEASQILEPSLIGLLASSHICRFVLIGDHKQLPAVVQQNSAETVVSEQCLRDIGLNDCSQSLFERLYRWEQSQGRTAFIGTLDRQGRMHPDVALFANRHFYGGRLMAVPCQHQTEKQLGYQRQPQDRLDEILQTQRMAFFAVTPPSTERATLTSNAAEARMVATLLRRIMHFYGERFDPARTVGVIVPYRNQIAAIRQAMADGEGEPLPEGLSVDTVERYQGSQRDVIIYSFTVTRRYQMEFLTGNAFVDETGQTIDRKLNVALTRARKQMLMVGHPAILSSNPLFRELMDAYTINADDIR